MTQATTLHDATAVERVPTVLIVDDEPGARALLKAVVHELGIPCRVEEAGDGDSAMEAVERRRPDLVLLDIVLPDSRASGVMLCRALCADPRTQVVVVSGHASESVMQACLAMGAAACVRKPFSVEEMRSKLAGWLAVPA